MFLEVCDGLILAIKNFYFPACHVKGVLFDERTKKVVDVDVKVRDNPLIVFHKNGSEGYSFPLSEKQRESLINLCLSLCKNPESLISSGKDRVDVYLVQGEEKVIKDVWEEGKVKRYIKEAMKHGIPFSIYPELGLVCFHEVKFCYECGRPTKDIYFVPELNAFLPLCRSCYYAEKREKRKVA